MFLFWLVVAVISYWFFRRWEATYQNPLICALLWPLVLIFFFVSITYMAIKDKLSLPENKGLYKESTNPPPVSIEKKDAVTIKAHELLGVDLTGKTVEQKNAICEYLISLSRTLLINDLDFDLDHCDSVVENLGINLNRKFILLHNLVLLKEEKTRRLTEGFISHEDSDPSHDDDESLDAFDLHRISNNLINLSRSSTSPEERFFVRTYLLNELVSEI
ncbi:hypothetical protein I4478_19815 [Klebsiella pneumoniae]|nr:hypothetical protein [Klebsiella pneumoniae]